MPRTELVFVLIYSDPRGDSSGGLPLTGGQLASPPKPKPRTMPHGWSLRFGTAQESRLYPEQWCHPSHREWMLSSQHCSPFPIPQSPSSASLLMVVRDKETKRRSHLLCPHQACLTSCLASRDWLLDRKRVRHIEKLWVSRIQRGTFFFFLHQVRRLAGVLSFSLRLFLLHFQETPEKNSTRHVFHCEAELLLSLGVPCACRRPPASTWTWTRLLREWAPGDVEDTAHTLWGPQVHKKGLK